VPPSSVSVEAAALPGSTSARTAIHRKAVRMRRKTKRLIPPAQGRSPRAGENDSAQRGGADWNTGSARLGTSAVPVPAARANFAVINI
jgi:hypothetical protein